MKSVLTALMLLGFVAGTCASELNGGATSTPALSLLPPDLVATAVQLRQEALRDELPVEIIESLTTEVGPRRMGTAGGKRGVAWAVAKMKALGFDKVWTEAVPYEGWERGEASAEVLAPYPHNMAVTALGYSAGTHGEALVGDIVLFASYDDLLAAKVGSLAGKIAFVNYRMTSVPGFTGYREGTRARGKGAVEAARRGAVALLIRSVGTDSNRVAHTGSRIKYEAGLKQIPAAAISNPDADLLENMLRRGQPVSVSLTMTARATGPITGHNVIGEFTGRELPHQYIALGAHLDSWDEGTGAVDDGAGVGSMMATAVQIGRLKQRPRRSIRVILFDGEEIGLIGAQQFLRDNQADIDNYWLGGEIDAGTGAPYKLTSGVGEASLPLMREIHQLLAPLGIEWSEANDAKGASDMSVLGKAGMPAFNFAQKPNNYFDYHHTPNDTFDKIDPEQIKQIVASFVVMAYLGAELDHDFRQ